MLALTTKVPGRNGPSPWAQAPHSVVLWTLNSMSSVPAPTGSMARLTEGTFGPKILGSVCISTICCLLMRAFCRKGPGGSLIPTLHCCPWPSGRCFLGTSCEPDHVLSMEAPSGPHSDPPWRAFPRAQAPDLALFCSKRGAYSALRTLCEARQGGETLSKSFLDPEPQSPRHLCCTADGKSETALAHGERPSQGLVTVSPDWRSGAPSHGSRVVTITCGWQALRGDQPFFLRQSVKSQLIQRSSKALSMDVS